MNVATFEASISYNDMVGSVSADQSSISQWLDERNMRNSSNELVFGIKLSFGENHGEEIVNPVSNTSDIFQNQLDYQGYNAGYRLFNQNNH